MFPLLSTIGERERTLRQRNVVVSPDARLFYAMRALVLKNIQEESILMDDMQYFFEVGVGESYFFMKLIENRVFHDTKMLTN